MSEKRMSDREKLQRDIDWLSDDSRKRVRKYVDKLRQIERMEAKARGEIFDLEKKAKETGDQKCEADAVRFTDAIVRIAATYADEPDNSPYAGRICALCGMGQSSDRWLISAFGKSICTGCIEYCVSVIQGLMLSGKEERLSRFHKKTFPIKKYRAMWRAMAGKSGAIVKEWRKRGGDGIDPLEFLGDFKGDALRNEVKEAAQIKRNCYCCDYAYDEEMKDYDCSLCPLQTGYRCIDSDSPFRRMIEAMKSADEGDFEKYAIEVAESPIAMFVRPRPE